MYIVYKTKSATIPKRFNSIAIEILFVNHSKNRTKTSTPIHTNNTSNKPFDR